MTLTGGRGRSREAHGVLRGGGRRARRGRAEEALRLLEPGQPQDPAVAGQPRASRHVRRRSARGALEVHGARRLGEAVRRVVGSRRRLGWG